MYDEAIEIVVAICKVSEGFRSRPYLCPAGYPTQGYGTVIRPDGKAVTLDDPPINSVTAERWLRYTIINRYMPGVLKASPILARHPKALAAVTDFAYNLGVPRYRASTLRKRIDACDWDRARLEIMRWNKAGGKVMNGLTKRRKLEAALLPITNEVDQQLYM